MDLRMGTRNRYSFGKGRATRQRGTHEEKQNLLNEWNRDLSPILECPQLFEAASCFSMAFR